MQQRALAVCADAGHFVERRASEFVGAARAMSADGETMRLVAQPLQEVEHRIARLEGERRPAGHEEALATGIAVGTLGDADNGDVFQAELGKHLARYFKLALAAVDQQKVGPMFLVALGVFLERPTEAARQHLAHHGKVVACGALGLDVELAVGILDEAVGAGHHHGADRSRALDVAVVVDLDALGGRVELEHAGEALEQLTLRAALGQAPRQRLAGIVHGEIEGVLLVSALGRADLHLLPGAEGQGAFEQFALVDVVAGQDELWRRPGFVELAHEGREDGRRIELLGVAGKIGAVAEILSCAQEVDLDADLAGIGVGREDVGLVDRGQADRLVRLDLCQRTDAIAQDRSPFEFERGGSLVHALGQRLLDFAVAAAQEPAHLVDDRRVFRFFDAADARRRAALDLVLQTGSRARREHAVGARAQREGALQGVERAVDGCGRSEGTEIFVARLTHATVLGELRPLGVAADDDVGERFVVAQQHVEAWPEALDQVVLEQQRLGLAAGDRELHCPGRRHHADQARGEPVRLGVGADAAAQ